MAAPAQPVPGATEYNPVPTTMSPPLSSALAACRQRIEAAAGGRPVRLLAVSKTQPVERVRALAGLGQREFGENYVQEALPKIAACAGTDLVWHFIGPLQSNKCAEVARHFDWLQSLDRPKLVPLLARFRPEDAAPLNVLIQVNIDDEASKSGCAPQAVPELAALVREQPALCLRGLMAIPRPDPDPARRREAFARMRALYGQLQATCPDLDTLSMGMSDDLELAIAEGATLVRVGSALFGPRPGPARRGSPG